MASVKTRKFEADKSHAIAGFWKPEKGDVLEGIIVEKAESALSEYLVIKLTKPLTVTGKDRTSGDEIERKVTAGREVGVSYWAALRGVERFSGHWIRIEILGKKKETGDDGRAFSRWVLDVNISDEIQEPTLAAVTVPSSNGKAKKRGKRSDADESEDADAGA